MICFWFLINVYNSKNGNYICLYMVFIFISIIINMILKIYCGENSEYVLLCN